MTFLEILEANNVPYVFRKADNELDLPECGSRIVFRTLNEPERLRGLNLAWFWADELTYTKEAAWTRLVGRLRHPAARNRAGIGTWTPKGFDFVYRRFIGPERLEGYGAVHARPFENASRVGDGYYEQQKHDLDDRFYRQEVLGEYLNVFSGQAYYTFDRGAHVADAIEIDPRFALCWTLDFNIDPACSVLAQIVDTTTAREASIGTRSRVIHIVDEIALPDSRTIEACKAFAARAGAWIEKGQVRELRIYGDASGASRHSSALDTDWRTVKTFLATTFPNLRVTWHVPSKNPPVKDRVAAVCAQLRSAAGEVGLRIARRAKELIADLEQVAWKRDLSGNPLDDLSKSDPKRTHTSDALGYLVYQERTAGGGPRSRVIL